MGSGLSWLGGGCCAELQSWGGREGAGGTATVIRASGPEEVLQEGVVPACGRRMSHSRGSRVTREGELPLDLEAGDGGALCPLDPADSDLTILPSRK